MNTHLQALQKITDRFFDKTLGLGELFSLCNEYSIFLNNLIEQNLDNQKNRTDIISNNGKAIGTYWAAMCITDFVRTCQFIKGINEAIEFKLEDQNQLNILYAGTGPFATLLLPLFTKFANQNIHYTLLEINPESFTILQHVITTLGLNNNNIELINGDATKFQLTTSPDIIISETMQNALAKEQQVPIYLNLMKQAKPNCIFIPEEINISIALKKAGVPIELVSKNDYTTVETVFRLNKDTLALVPQTTETNTSPVFPLVSTTITQEQLKGNNLLVLITLIKVFNNHTIGLNESGLTTPLIIDPIKDSTRSISITTQYVIEQEPKLNYTVRQSELPT